MAHRNRNIASNQGQQMAQRNIASNQGQQMAQSNIAFNQDQDLAESDIAFNQVHDLAQSNIASNFDNPEQIFPEAFQVYINGIIYNLPPDKDATTIKIAVEALVPQISIDHNRIIFVIERIQARVKRDVMWVDSAISLYDGIAAFVNASFPWPGMGLPAHKRGAFGIQYCLIKSLEKDLDTDMKMLLWNVGLIHFMGRLGASRGSIAALPPHVILYILTRMMVSDSLFHGENLGLCLDYVVHVGPFLDSAASGATDEFTGSLMQLRERVRGMGGRVGNMAILWVLKLREDGWKAQQVE